MFSSAIYKRLIDECREELSFIGIQLPNNISFSINTRAKRTLGFCSKKNGTFVIEVSAVFANSSIEKDIKNTIIHEMLHTLDDCMNHGKVWQSYADRVNRSLGYHIKRTNINKGAEEHYRYKITCQSCGYSWKRMKRCDLVDNPHDHWCSKCGRLKGTLAVTKIN